MIAVGGIALGFPLVAGFFGWSTLNRLTRLDRAEKFAASWGISFAFVVACQFLSFAFHASQFTVSIVILAAMVIVALLFRSACRREEEARDSGFTFLLVACGLAYLHLLFIQFLLPNYRGSSWYYDWCMHYEEALVFVGDRPVDDTWANGYTLASRTPLFNLTMAFVMSLAGHDFAVFQTASVLTNIAFVSAVYLLLRDLFGQRAARLALLLAPLNLWMLHDAWYTWSKMLTAYYLLLALHFYIKSVRLRATEPRKASVAFLSFGICGLLAFMTHQVGLIYVLPLLLHAAVLAWKDRFCRPRLMELVVLATAVVLLVLPWYGWLAVTLGMDKIAQSTPASLGEESARFHPLEVVGWMSFNIAFSMIPAGLINSFFTGWPEDIGMPSNLEELWRGLQHVRLTIPSPSGVYRGATELYFSLLTGALTLSLTGFLVYRAWKRWREKPARPVAGAGVFGSPGSQQSGASEDSSPGHSNTCNVRSAIWFFLILGTLGAAILHPGKIWWGIAHSAAFPTAILIVALGWGALSNADARTGRLVCTGIVLEFLAMFWSHWWFLTHRPDVLETLPGNEEYKEKGIALLNDLVGDWQYLFLAGAVVIQAILVVLLHRFWRHAGRLRGSVRA